MKIDVSKKIFDKNITIDVRTSSKMTAKNYKHIYDEPSCDVILAFCFSRNNSSLCEHLDLPLITLYLSDFYDNIEFGHIDLISL
ncbi:hypothetical protein ARAF_0090 [Arsenophonus endosymbiont of Aleurodicus floccissimus]|uniref:hypothetical protein n=1 Tax=Arsenophonus endosymbiont of Aleurodicus floccissimus TaxID=2152761 RepID=UPI000E6AFD9A|nr:hypothetical protein ARAF_0090 [Arsenophonus endosymbiont of Aleurodicus floccissimus]